MLTMRPKRRSRMPPMTCLHMLNMEPRFVVRTLDHCDAALASGEVADIPLVCRNRAFGLECLSSGIVAMNDRRHAKAFVAQRDRDCATDPACSACNQCYSGCHGRSPNEDKAVKRGSNADSQRFLAPVAMTAIMSGRVP